MDRGQWEIRGVRGGDGRAGRGWKRGSGEGVWRGGKRGDRGGERGRGVGEAERGE